jgi:hypothetical protein
VTNERNDLASWARTVIGIAVAIFLSWSTWVTLNVANYQSGEVRGERLTGTEAAVMINAADVLLRAEWTKANDVMETRFNARIAMISELVNTMVKQNIELISILKLQNELLQRSLPQQPRADRRTT